MDNDTIRELIPAARMPSRLEEVVGLGATAVAGFIAGVGLRTVQEVTQDFPLEHKELAAWAFANGSLLAVKGWAFELSTGRNAGVRANWDTDWKYLALFNGAMACGYGAQTLHQVFETTLQHYF